MNSPATLDRAVRPAANGPMGGGEFVEKPGTGTSILVWNLPLRIWHWGFAASLSGAWFLGNSFDPEGDVFKYHMPLGLLAGFFVAVRVVFGIVGSRHARWTRFFFTPWHTVRYLFDAVRFRSRAYAGINPGTSLVALGMYLAVAAVIYTGFAADYVEIWHGWLADSLLWLVGLHLAGLFVHTLGHRDWLALSMITGRKVGDAADGLPRENWIGGWLFLGLCIALAAALYFGFDKNECVLKIPGLPPLYLPLVQKG
jgi:cytochrome b